MLESARQEMQSFLRQEDPPPGFFSAIFGIIFEPFVTQSRLLNREHPPYGFRLFVLFIVTVFTPILSLFLQHNLNAYHWTAVASLATVVFLTLSLFLLLEGAFLQMIGIEYRVKHLFAAIAYATSPLIVAIWLIYLFNYFYTGRLTIITTLMAGTLVDDDLFLLVIPISTLIAQLLMALVLLQGLRIVGGITWMLSFVLTIMSIGPYYGSFFIALVVGDAIRPGTMAVFLQLLLGPLRVMALSL